jgi:hypothetical protein
MKGPNKLEEAGEDLEQYEREKSRSKSQMIRINKTNFTELN